MIYKLERYFHFLWKWKLFLFPQFKCYMKHCTFMFVAAILLLIIGPISSCTTSGDWAVMHVRDIDFVCFELFWWYVICFVYFWFLVGWFFSCFCFVMFCFVFACLIVCLFVFFCFFFPFHFICVLWQTNVIIQSCHLILRKQRLVEYI